MINAKEIYYILLKAYGQPRWWSDDPFVVMLQSVLVQNTTWSSVEKDLRYVCQSAHLGIY